MSGGRLAPPAARQGPGPLPAALVEALDLALVRRAARGVPGDRRAPGVGTGSELAQLRPYQSGDDVRHLDAAATARTGLPHVRLHVPERALTTWLVLDVSPSMAFGTGRRLKADVAEGVALVLGRLAVRGGGGLAAVSFGAGAHRTLAPRTSRVAFAALQRLLSEGVATDGHADTRALAHALRSVALTARQPGLVVIVSDFRDQQSWLRPLGLLRARHSVMAVDIGDPRERELPKLGRLAVVDPESGRRIEVDTTRARVRARFAELEAERREALARDLRGLRVEHITLSTDGDWLADLGRGLR